VRVRCAGANVRLLINSAHDEACWSRADGVHLRATDLMRLDRRPSADWCIASCHDAIELARAGQLAIDAAVVGPVAATASHPGRPGIGWSAFTTIAATSAIPVYAIGGMGMADLDTAIAAGGHGIASIRSAWSDGLS